MATKYGHLEEDTIMANEPLSNYGVEARQSCSPLGNYLSATQDTDELPLDIIRIAVECAIDDEKNGRLIPHEQMRERVAKEMGWV